MCNLIFTLCYSRAASLQQSTIGYMCGKFKAAALGKSLFSPVSPTNHIFYPAWLSCFGWGLLCARGSGFVDSGGRVLRRISAPGGRERFNLACLADRKCAAHCIHACLLLYKNTFAAQTLTLTHFITFTLPINCRRNAPSQPIIITAGARAPAAIPPCSSSCPHVKAPSNAF